MRWQGREECGEGHGTGDGQWREWVIYLWKTYGKPLENRWNTMENLQKSHGKNYGTPIETQLENLWKTYGKQLETYGKALVVSCEFKRNSNKRQELVFGDVATSGDVSPAVVPLFGAQPFWLCPGCQTVKKKYPIRALFFATAWEFSYMGTEPFAESNQPLGMKTCCKIDKFWQLTIGTSTCKKYFYSKHC